METIDFAARHRYPYMTVFMPMDQRKQAYELYRRLAEEKYGYEAGPEQLAFCTPVVLAETDEQAMKDGEKYTMWLFRKAMKIRREFFVPPGYMSVRGIRAVIANNASFGQGERSFKELVETGVVIAGSPATVIEKLSYYTDVLHAGMLVTGGHVGEIPDDLVLRFQEMMAKEVMPAFREKTVPVESKPAEI